jgi:hypothetical protein
MALFPFFKVIPALTAEVQPIGGLLGFGVWAMMRRPSMLGRALRPLEMVIAAYTAVFVAGFVVMSAPPANLDTAAETLAILLAPLGLALGLASCIEHVSPKGLAAAMLASASLGTVQRFAPVILQTSGLSTVLSTVIPRLTGPTADFGDRGVSMLAPEPSYAAPTILLMLTAALWLHSRRRISGRWLVSGLALTAWMIWLNSSVTLVTGVVLFGMVLLISLGLRSRAFAVPAIVIPIVGLWYLSSFQASDVRPLRATAEISESVMDGGISLDDFLALSDRYGSTRLQSVIVGYSEALNDYGAGRGLAGDASDSVIGTSKPFAYGAFVAMHLGLPGLVALVYGLAHLVLKSARHRPRELTLATLALGLSGILINSPSSLPAYWVIIVFALPWAVPDRWAQRRPSPLEEAHTRPTYEGTSPS